MRKIEKDIIGAFIRGEEARKDNTESNGTTLFLHGNAIAKHYDGAILLSNAGWNTRTTQSRLNAVLRLAGKEARIFTKKGIMYFTRNGNSTPMFSDWYAVY